MNPEVQLVLGCFGLGLVITYALWTMVRAELHRGTHADSFDPGDPAEDRDR